jgi:glycerol-3-phosphate responsive antiterminator
VVPRASFTFGEQIQMIVSTILGLVMNIVMVDNATGQNLTRAILLHKKVLEINVQEQDLKEDQKQLAKDLITGEQNNDNRNP